MELIGRRDKRVLFVATRDENGAAINGREESEKNMFDRARRESEL